MSGYNTNNQILKIGDRPVNSAILDSIESKSLKENTPHFDIGDIIDVSCKIREGNKERVQIFIGTVISR
ncbi:MAG: 50S ribosomal protein L19, partial [Planctomycetota bacterium]